MPLADKTAVANLALDLIGEPYLTDLDTDTGVTAECVRLHYPQALETVLEGHVWSFATRCSQLTAVLLDETFASLTFGDEVENAAILLTAVTAGPSGNDISFVMTVDSEPEIQVSLDGQTLAVVASEVADETASLTLDPAGEDNAVLYEAVAAGTGGNAISVEYAAQAADQLAISIFVDESAILVTPGDKHQMLVTGDVNFNGSLAFVGFYEGSACWSDDPENLSNPTDPNPGTGTFYRSSPFSPWINRRTAGGTPPYINYQSFEIDLGSGYADFPSGAAAWDEGTFTVTAPGASAQQVIDAVNADATAGALVTASAAGTVTGAVAAVAEANLTGGTNVISTAAEVIAAINAEPEAAALVLAANAGASDGSGEVASLSLTALSGGTSVSTVFAPAYGSAFNLPEDCLRLIKIDGEDIACPRRDFEIQGRYLLLEEAEAEAPVIHYITNAPPVPEWPTTFADAVAALLASRIAPKLIQNPQLAQQLAGGHEMALGKARSKDARETRSAENFGPRQLSARSGLVRARYGGSPALSLNPPPES